MARGTSPFISRLAGSLKNGPTFRNNPHADGIIIEKKPTPTDGRTPRQAAVREGYRRLISIWKNNANLDLEPYQIIAEKKNVTAWNAFLHFHLPIMSLAPVHYCPLADYSQGVVSDFAQADIPGAITNGTLTERNGFPSISYPVANPKILFNSPGTYDSSPTFSGLMICRPSRPGASQGYFIGTKNLPADVRGFVLFYNTDNTIRLHTGLGASNVSATSSKPLQPGQLHVIGFSRSGNQTALYYDGRYETTTTAGEGMASSGLALHLATTPANSYDMAGEQYISAIFPSLITEKQFKNLDERYRRFYK